MNFLDQVLTADWITRLGWTLLHSLWEIALVATVLALLLSLLRRGSANVRYLAACGGLAAMAIVPVVTFGLLPDHLTANVVASATAEEAEEATPEPVAASPAEVVAVAEGEMPDTAVVVSVALGEQNPATLPPAQVVASPAPPSTAEAPASDTSDKSSLQQFAAVLSPWMPWCVAAWFVGVFALSVWNLGGWIAAQRLKRLGTDPIAEDIARRLSSLAERSGINRAVAVLKSLMVEVPVVVGWLRPVILLPAGILTGLTPSELDAILAHELAHIRRHDYLVNLLQTVIETLFFYHPGVWWLSRRIRAEREHCCDDMAVAVCGNKVDYASALAAVEAGRATPKMAMAARKTDGSTLERIRRVLGFAGDVPSRWGRSLAGGLVTSAMIVALVTCFVLADEPTTEQPDWSAAAAKVFPDWKIAESGRYQKADIGTAETSRLLLSKSRWEYVGQPAQLIAQTGEIRDADLADNPNYRRVFSRVDILTFDENADLPQDVARRLPWTEWEDADATFVKTVDLGTGLGRRWFVRTTLMCQHQLRTKLELVGGDDPMRVLAEGLLVKDKGTCTANSVEHLLAPYGDKAVVYLQRQIEKSNRPEDLARLVRPLAYIHTKAADDLLRVLYAEERTEDAAGYAVIRGKPRAGNKAIYFDVLKKRRWIQSAGRACVALKWHDAAPILREIYTTAEHRAEREASFMAWRNLQGRPIPDELIQARINIAQYADNPETTAVVEKARTAILDSPDKEAAMFIATSLATSRAYKIPVDKIEAVRRIGKELLAELGNDTGASDVENEAVIWGAPVDGIACSVRPVKASFAPDDDIEVDVSYKNVSEKPITVCVCPDQLYTWLHLWVKTAEEKNVLGGAHGTGTRPPLKRSDFVTLKPQQTTSFRQVIPRSQHEYWPEPGNYFLHAEINKINRIDEHLLGYGEFCAKHGLTPWVAGVESGAATVTIAEEPSDELPVGDDGRIAQLIDQLGDDTFGRREAAQRELIRIRRPCRAALDAACRHADPEVAARAKRCLAEIYPAESLIAALRGEDDRAWTAAVIALQRLGEPAVRELIEALEDRNPRVRRGAVQALGEIEVPRVIDPLIKMLNDPEATIRTDAAAGLGNLASYSTKNLRPVRLVPALAAALKDEDRHVRSAATWALWQSNDSRAVQPLLEALRDEHLSVRWRAAEGLGYLRAKTAVEPLTAALQSDNQTLRSHAANALGRIGDRRPLPQLSALASTDEDAGVRAAAGEALRIIQYPQTQLAPTVWGEPVDGLQAGLRCTSGTASYRHGEIVHFQLLVRNTTDQPVTLEWMANGWSPMVQANRVELLGLCTINGIIDARRGTIPPHGEVSTHTIRYVVRPPDWEKRDSQRSLRVAAGEYEVSASFGSHPHDPEAKDVWQGKLPTGKLSLTVATGESAGPTDAAAEVESPRPLETVAWGNPLAGLRCRWSPSSKPVLLGTKPMISMEVENTSDKPVFWNCVSQLTLALEHPSSPGTHIMPEFSVRPGKGSRLATKEEVLEQFSNERTGHYRLEPKGRVVLTAEYPWAAAKSGSFEIDGFVFQIYPLTSVDYPAEKNEVRCPPLILSVVTEDNRDAASGKPEDKNVAWGEIVDGLQAGLTTAFEQPRPYKIGTNVPLRFLLRNTTDKPIMLTHARVPVFINWDNYGRPPGPQLLDPDGKQVFPASGVGGRGLPDTVARTIAPGEVITMTTTRLPLRPNGWKGTTVNLLTYFVGPGKHQATLSYGFGDGGGKYWGGTVTTGALDLFVHDGNQPLSPPGIAWGQYSEGVRCRLNVDKPRLRPGEPPILFVDLQNHDTKRTIEQIWHGLEFKLEVDGKWTGKIAPMMVDGPVGHLTPGQEWINVPLVLGGNQYYMTGTNSEPGGPADFSKLLGPGRHTIRVDIDGVVSNPVEIEVLPSTPKPTTPDIPADHNADRNARSHDTQEGQVVGIDGQGIAGASVDMWHYVEVTDANGRKTKERVELSQRTDADGRFKLLDVEPATGFFAEVSAPGYFPRDSNHIARVFRVTESRYDNATIILKRSVTLSGKVIGRDGKPLAGAPLSVTTDVEYGNSSALTANHLRAISDDDGNFRIDNAPPGDLFIYYPWEGPIMGEVHSGKWRKWTKLGERYPSAPTKGLTWVKLIQAKAGRKVDDLVVDLSKSTCVVEGRVVDAKGEPVIGARMVATWKLETPSGTSKGHTVPDGNPPVHTDTDGRYRLTGLPPLQTIVVATIKITGNNNARGVRTYQAETSAKLLSDRTVTANLRFDEKIDTTAVDSARRGESAEGEVVASAAVDSEATGDNVVERRWSDATIDFTLRVTEGTANTPCGAEIVITNKTDETQSVPTPFVMPSCGDTNKNNIRVSDMAGNTLNIRGIHFDFEVGRPATELAAKESKTWKFELEKWFADMADPGTYLVEPWYFSDHTQWSSWVGRVAMQPLTVVRKESHLPAWSKPVDGVSVRVTRAISLRHSPDMSLASLLLEYDARNGGERILHLPDNGLCHQIEVDGQWYDWVDPRLVSPESDEPHDSRGTTLQDFPPDRCYRDQRVKASDNWRAIPKGKEQEYAESHYSDYFLVDNAHGEQLVLTPGKHRVRLAVICPSARASDRGVIRVVSEEVEVDVLPPPDAKNEGSDAEDGNTDAKGGATAGLPKTLAG